MASPAIEDLAIQTARLPPQAYQISLRAVLIGFIVFAGIFACTAQYGWIIGLMLATWSIAAGMIIWAIRYGRRIALSGGLVLALTGTASGVLYRGAPFRDTSGFCIHCGIGFESSERWLQPVRFKLKENDAWRWARQVGLRESQHAFANSSCHLRVHWFGIAPLACGGFNPVGQCYYARAFVGDARAVAVLREYQSLRAQNQAADAARLMKDLEVEVECLRYDQEWNADVSR